MKNIFVLILFFVSTTASAQFRNTTWGMSKKQVKEIEQLKLSSDYNNALDYNFNIEDLNCRLQYHFNDKDKLISITYIFSNEARTTYNLSDAQKIYDRTINNIKEKYGEPSIVESSFVKWNSKNYSINAIINNYNKTVVTYTPPAPSQKDLL